MSFVGKWFGFGRDEHYDRGVRSFDCGMYEDAIQHFQRCARSSSDSAAIRLARFYTAESYAQLGLASLRSENYDHAVGYLTQAIGIHPNFPDLRFHLSLAYEALGDRAMQRAQLEKALEINPKFARAVLYQGIMLYEESIWEAGMARIAEAIALDPDLDGERYRFACECHRTGDTARALANFRALASSDSSDANAHAKVGDTFARQGLWVEAAQEYQLALEISPRYADIRCRLGQALLQQDRVEQATEQFKIALEINPKYADAHAYLGIALRRSGEEAEAKRHFQAALAIDPQHLVATEEADRLRVP